MAHRVLCLAEFQDSEMTGDTHIMRMLSRLLMSTTLVVASFSDTSASRSVGVPKCALATPVERLKTSKAVFTGRVIEIQEADGIQIVKFTVRKSWKYVRGKETTIVNYVHHEGPYFRKGQNYLVFAYARRGMLTTGACSGTIDVEFAGDEMQALDKWKAQKSMTR